MKQKTRASWGVKRDDYYSLDRLLLLWSDTNCVGHVLLRLIKYVPRRNKGKACHPKASKVFHFFFPIEKTYGIPNVALVLSNLKTETP